jgi:hypothetical protein
LGSIIGYTLWITVISVLPLQIAHKTSKIAPFWVFAPCTSRSWIPDRDKQRQTSGKNNVRALSFCFKKLLFINMIKNMTMGVVSLPSNAGGRILEPRTGFVE